jgi:hypothetical protein
MDRKNERENNRFSKSHGKAEKPVTSTGYPRLRHVTVPGYNGAEGTPSYIAAAASRGERYVKTCGTGGGKQGETPDHRRSGAFDTGAPPKGGQARLQDPDKKIRETKV